MHVFSIIVLWSATVCAVVLYVRLHERLRESGINRFPTQFEIETTPSDS